MKYFLLLIILPFCFQFLFENSYADEFVRKDRLEIICKCAIERASILGNEVSENSCAGSLECFTYKKSILEIEQLRSIIKDKFLLLESQSDLLKLKEDIESKVLNGIKEEVFKNHIFGITLVQYFGLQFIKNERIVETQGKYYFEYETWKNDSDSPIPHCIWERIYIIKLPRKSF